jgi:hypothetical protein
MCVLQSVPCSCSTAAVVEAGGPSPLSPYLALFATVEPNLRKRLTASWGAQYASQALKISNRPLRWASPPTVSLPAVADLYFVQQHPQDNLCRMHALNAVLGRPGFSAVTFYAMCDSFDAVAGLPVGTSRVEYAAADNGTLFAYALAWAGSPRRTLALSPYASSGTGSDIKSASTLSRAARTAAGAIAYNGQHAWALLRTSSGWWSVDSLASAPSRDGLVAITAAGVGVEFVFAAPVPLRIGYISRRFESYPGTQLMLRMFESHNRRRVHVRVQRRDYVISRAYECQ